MNKRRRAWIRRAASMGACTFLILLSMGALASHGRSLASRVSSASSSISSISSFRNAMDDPPPALRIGEPRTIIAIVLGAAGAALSSAGGVGGGGLFVPMFNLLLRFDTRTSAVLSNFMIFGGMVANMLWSAWQRHPTSPDRPLINLDAALLMQPGMLLGISLGVVCNVMFPGWLLTALLAVTLAIVTFRSCRCGFRMWKEESYIGSHIAAGSSLLDEEAKLDEQVEDLEPQAEADPGCLSPSMSKLTALVVVWFCFFAVQIVRGSKTSKGLFKLSPCGTGYWIITSLQLPLTLVFTIRTLSHFDKQETKELEELGEMNFGTSRKLPVMALFAGVLGGLLGIGGGMLINPLLMELGMHPQVTAATSAFMVFFSSSLSVVQYWLMGRIPVDYAVCFFGVCFVFSLLGLLVVQRVIVKSGRASIIIFLVSLVMALSAVLLAGFGSLEVWRQYKAGEYMGFRSPC